MLNTINRTSKKSKLPDAAVKGIIGWLNINMTQAMVATNPMSFRRSPKIMSRKEKSEIKLRTKALLIWNPIKKWIRCKAKGKKRGRIFTGADILSIWSGSNSASLRMVGDWSKNNDRETETKFISSLRILSEGCIDKNMQIVRKSDIRIPTKSCFLSIKATKSVFIRNTINEPSQVRKRAQRIGYA